MGYEEASPVFLLNRPEDGAGKAALIALLILVLFTGLGALGGAALLWFAKPPKNIGPPVDEAFYYRRIWGSAASGMPPHFSSSSDLAAMQAYAIYYLWDVYPLLEQVPEAENLALKWPPARGSRYRLAAYPFVQSGKEPVPLAVARGVLQMINKYKDQATPPAWFVSVYDDADWTRQNIFLPPPAAPSTHMTCRSSKIFQPFKWIEVTRTCYPVKKDSYPLCDDGGQWYYHAPGSGVWYNLGNTLVRYNKIDAAVYCMALTGIQYATSGAPDAVDAIFGDLKGDFQTLLLPLAGPKRDQLKAVYASLLQVRDASLDDYPSYDPTKPPTWQAYWAVAKAHFAKKLQGSLGETSFVRALTKLVKDSRSTGIGNLKLDGFLPFQAFSTKPGTPRLGYLTLLAAAGGLLGLLVAVLFLFVKGQLVTPLALLLAAGTGLWFGWVEGLEAFVNSQGIYMLAKGLQLKRASVEDVVGYCVEPVVNGATAPEPQQFFSGVPSSWIADLIIEVLASTLGFDTVVMHSQPNKQGTYLVEIVDVTKILLAFGAAPAGDPQWWKGGTCGNDSAATPLGAFACADCPWPGAAGPATRRVRGGLCYNSSDKQPVPAKGPASSNYYTLSWKNAQGVVAAETAYAPQPYPFDDAAKKAMATWLQEFDAVPCKCREGAAAACLGCQGFISDHLCNWSNPDSSLSPA